MQALAKKQGYATTILKTKAATRGAVQKGIQGAAAKLAKRIALRRGPSRHDPNHGSPLARRPVFAA